jgi:drug/metabolite transporter (DMT)-like permease
MSRRIVTRSFPGTTPFTRNNKAAGSAALPLPDSYYNRLFKYIPADIVAGWIAVKGIIASMPGGPNENLYRICFIAGVILTFFWTYKMTTVEGHKPAWTQIVVSTVAFIVWVVVTGEPFNLEPYIGSLILVAYTLGSGLIIPKE